MKIVNNVLINNIIINNNISNNSIIYKVNNFINKYKDKYENFLNSNNFIFCEKKDNNYNYLISKRRKNVDIYNKNDIKYNENSYFKVKINNKILNNILDNLQDIENCLSRYIQEKRIKTYSISQDEITQVIFYKIFPYFIYEINDFINKYETNYNSFKKNKLVIFCEETDNNYNYEISIDNNEKYKIKIDNKILNNILDNIQDIKECLFEYNKNKKIYSKLFKKPFSIITQDEINKIIFYKLCQYNS